jgi:hypothetical protein
MDCCPLLAKLPLNSHTRSSVEPQIPPRFGEASAQKWEHGHTADGLGNWFER